MIRKISVWLIAVLAIGVSFYYYNELPNELPSKFANLEGNPTQYAPKNIVLFIMPFTMIISSLSLLSTSLFRKHSDVLKRFDKGIVNISLALNSVLFILHCTIIYISLGNQFNILLLLPIIVGIVFIITGNTLPRLQLKAFKNTNDIQQATYDLWNRVARTFSYALFFGGVLMLLSVFLPENLIILSFLIILFSTIIAAFLFSYIKYSRSTNSSSNFDK